MNRLGLMMLPWLATAPGTALYLPAQILDQGKGLFDPEDLAQRLEKYHYARAGGPAARARPDPAVTSRARAVAARSTSAAAGMRVDETSVMTLTM